MRLRFEAGAVYLPEQALWLDAHEPQPGLVFVSHAHVDHVAPHGAVILSAPTARFMQARMPGVRLEHVLPFGEPRTFANVGKPFRVRLLPAGHIFGSAMALVDNGDQELLYTGDFKLRRGLSAEPCEPAPADILVMETTFGRPEYVFPPVQRVLENIVRFCREALDHDETPVLLGYSLGKSQELLCSLGEAGLALMLHGSIFKLTRIYEQFGQCFPPYEPYQPGFARGKVLLCPPQVVNSAMLRNLGKRRTAIITGWAVDPNCKYRYQCDAAFPLSDHADFPELLQLVERVRPRTVYTLHGFAAEFAQTLRDLGYDARSLSQEEQFALALPNMSRPTVTGAALVRQTAAPESPSSLKAASAAELFAAFAETCRRIAGEAGKLEKVRLLGSYLRSLRGNSLRWATTWFTGRPFPASENLVLQLGWAVLRDALCGLLEVPASAFHQAYLQYSDLGEAAAELLKKTSVQPSLSLAEVAALFRDIQKARGPLAKRPLLERTLARCSPLEAKYLVKIITGDLRIGLKEGLVEEAVAAAFQQPVTDVRGAHLLLGSLGETAEIARQGRLADASLEPFRPVRFMLASPELTAADIWKRVEERGGPGSQPRAAGETSAAPAPTVSAWVEDKYDGVRCQLHKVGTKVALYSRDLKEITATFPDVADAARKLQHDLVLDGEILAMNGDTVLPFSELQKRLGRREPDLFMREEVPIAYVAFDLLWANGASTLNAPLRERRKLLEPLTAGAAGLRLARTMGATGAADIEEAFAAARARGNEGLMVKDPESFYSPGRRGMAWLKLKKAFATLDCVVIGAEYGHGKRSKVLSDYTFAVRDEATGELKTIGKAYTGLTDQEIAEFTEHFLKIATRQQGRYFEVPPEVVLEIAFDRLQESDRHNSGLAMRFPRIQRIRTDKGPAEIDTVQTARELLRRLNAREPAAG